MCLCVQVAAGPHLLSDAQPVGGHRQRGAAGIVQHPPDRSFPCTADECVQAEGLLKRRAMAAGGGRER